MKKIVGILGMAAVLASGAFAAEPTADFKIAEFKGSAEFGWKANFKDSDAVTMGMYNETAANLKVGFITKGDKSTTGEGVWGELKIKVGDTALSNGQIPLGNVKDGTDGDSDPDYGFIENGKGATDKTYKANGYLVTIDDKGNAVMNLPNFLPVATVETAKIHFVDGDFSAALNILVPSLKYDGYAPFLAVPTGTAATKIDGTGALKAGFGLELAMKDMFGFNFKLMDNGAAAKASEKKFGMAFDASLKAVKNLDARIAASFNFDTEYAGFLVDAAYKMALDSLSDKTYLKFGAGYSLNHTKNGTKFTDANSLVAGVMFGWGAEGQKPELDYLHNDKDKFNEGISLAVSNNLEPILTNKDHMSGNSTGLVIGLYDQSLFSFLGLDAETFGVLKTGFEYSIGISASDSEVEQGGKKYKVSSVGVNNAMTVALKYSVKANIFDIALHGGIKGIAFGSSTVKGPNFAEGKLDETKTTVTKTEGKPAFKYGVTVGTKEVIDNTNIYISYEGEYDTSKATDKAKVLASDLKIGTKISF